MSNEDKLRDYLQRATTDLKQVKRIYDEVERHPERIELNLYITGYDED